MLSRDQHVIAFQAEAVRAMLIPYASMACVCNFTFQCGIRRHRFGKSSSIASSDGIKPSDAATLMSDGVPGAQ
jgi:hypothetical protein